MPFPTVPVPSGFRAARPAFLHKDPRKAYKPELVEAGVWMAVDLSTLL